MKMMMKHLAACLLALGILSSVLSNARAADPGTPAAPAQTPGDHLLRASGQVIEPVFFVTGLACRAPQYLRPVRALWTIITLPLGLLDPVDTAFDIPEVPGDLWAPFGATIDTVKDTPKLFGPIKALGSVALAAGAALSGAPEPAAPVAETH